MRKSFLTILLSLLLVTVYAGNYKSFHTGNPGLSSGVPPAPTGVFGKFDQIQKINIHFSVGAYPFKMPAGDDGSLISETEIGLNIGFDLPVGNNNFGMRFTFFDGKDNVGWWDNYSDNAELKIFILDFYAMRQYTLVKKLDAYVKVGVPIKMVRGLYVDDTNDEVYDLDYTTLGIAGEIGLKLRVLKHLAITSGYYKSIMFKGSHVGYFPFFGLNFYF